MPPKPPELTTPLPSQQILTKEPLFIGKCRLLPGSCYVVGVDTAERILDPKYYGGPQGLADMLQEMHTLGVRVAVAGRVSNPKEGTGTFRSLADLHLPQESAALFTSIPESVFRSDLSSTILRKQQNHE